MQQNDNNSMHSMLDKFLSITLSYILLGEDWRHVSNQQIEIDIDRDYEGNYHTNAYI